MINLRTLLKSDYYSSRFKKIEGLAKELTPKTNILFPKYTNHDIIHLCNVEDNINNIIPDEIKNSFSEEEIFCLLSAVYFHDIGMIPFDEELLDFKNNSNEDNEKLENNIRENHNFRSAEYIKKHREDLGINELEAEAISNICKGHRGSFVDFKDINSSSKIRVSILAAILRLGDECDITERRGSPLSEEGIDKYTIKEHYKIFSLVKKN